VSPWPLYRSGIVRQIGGTQFELLRRAAGTSSGQIMLAGTAKQDNAQWCALKRMVQRGLFDRYTFGGARFGKVTIYTITDAGRRALAREEAKDERG
jgi:hypothetical protein